MLSKGPQTAVVSRPTMLSKGRPTAILIDHPFAFHPSAVSVMPLSQERILRWSYLRLDQSAYHGWLSMMTSSEGLPFLVLPRAPPTLNPPLIVRANIAYHRLSK